MDKVRKRMFVPKSLFLGVEQMRTKIEEGIKDCLFQYGTTHEMIEDTGLISAGEAEELWDKYIEDIKNRWNEYDSPNMCIWINCKTDTDYHTVGKEIDFRDCELENGRFYKREVVR